MKLKKKEAKQTHQRNRGDKMREIKFRGKRIDGDGTGIGCSNEECICWLPKKLRVSYGLHNYTTQYRLKSEAIRAWNRRTDG